MPTKVYFGGAYTDPDTRDMLAETQRVSGRAILLTQGSYSTSVDASAGTHDGGGVVDINVSGWDYGTIWNILTVSRSMGGIAWHRTQAQGFAYHIHVVRRDCGDLSAAARAQVVQYLNGYNGLAGHKVNGVMVYTPDDGPLGYTDATWAGYKAGTSAYRPPIDTSEEDDMTPEQDARLKNIEKALQYPGGGGASWSQALANQMGANQTALLARLTALEDLVENVQKQGQVPGAGYDYNPAIINELAAIKKLVTALGA